MKLVLVTILLASTFSAFAGSAAKQNRLEFVDFVDSNNLTMLEGQTESGKECRVVFYGAFADFEVEGQDANDYFTSAGTKYCDLDDEKNGSELLSVGYEPDDNAFSAMIISRDVSYVEFYDFETKFGLGLDHMRKRSCKDLTRRVERRKPTLKCFINR